MTLNTQLTKIQNWLNNATIFEIIKDRHRIDTIVQDIDSNEGYVNIEILQFVNIFSLYKKLDKQRQEVVHRISQTDDLGERLKIGEELTKIETEEKQFLKNVLYTAHSFTDMKLEGAMENIAEAFFKGNVEQANSFLNPQQLTNDQDKALQLVQEKVKLEQAYDKLEDNANEFKVKAQLTVLNFDIVDADDRFEKAVFYFERGILSIKSVQKPLNTADFLFEYAHFIGKQNQLDKAKLNYLEILNLYKSIGNRLPDIAATLNNLGGIEREIHQFEKAKEYYKQALGIYEELAKTETKNYLSDVAMMFNNLGNLYSGINSFDIANQFYEQALSVYQELIKVNPSQDYSFEYSTVLTNFGRLLNITNSIEKSETLLTQSLLVERSLKDKNPSRHLPNIAMVLSLLGSLQKDKNDFDKAKKCYREALSIYRELAEVNPRIYFPDIAMTLNNIGTIHNIKGEFENATINYDEALIIYRKSAEINTQVYFNEISGILNNWGLLCLSQNQLTKAENKLSEALIIRRSLVKNNSGAYLFDLSETLNNLGMLWNKKKEYTKAEMIFNEALTIKEQLAKKDQQAYLPNLAITQINLSIFYLQSKPNKEKSFKLADKAITNLLLFKHIPYTEIYLNTGFQVLNALGINKNKYLREKQNS